MIFGSIDEVWGTQATLYKSSELYDIPKNTYAKGYTEQSNVISPPKNTIISPPKKNVVEKFGSPTKCSCKKCGSEDMLFGIHKDSFIILLHVIIIFLLAMHLFSK